MRKIAEDAGCSATAIYIHFKDKESLIEALSLEDFLVLASSLAPLAKTKDPLTRLRRMSEAYVQLALENPHSYRFLFMTSKTAVHPERSLVRDRPEENAYLMLRATIEEALHKGLFRKGLKDADALAQSFLAGVHGVVALHLTNFNDPWIPWRPVKARARLMLDTLIRGLTA